MDDDKIHDAARNSLRNRIAKFYFGAFIRTIFANRQQFCIIICHFIPFIGWHCTELLKLFSMVRVESENFNSFSEASLYWAHQQSPIHDSVVKMCELQNSHTVVIKPRAIRNFISHRNGTKKVIDTCRDNRLV